MSRRVLLAALVLVAIAVAMITLPVAEWSASVVAYVRGAGLVGVLVFSLVYVGATLAFLPGSMLTAGAGFAYGALFGTLIVSPVSTLAATLAFLLARTVARGWVERRIAADPRFARLQRAVSARGFRLILLLRLSPLLPFNLLNYGLGLTGVRTRDYVLASFIGMLPGTILYVYLGSLVTSASALASGDLPSGGPWQTALYAGGLVCSIVVAVVVTRLARRALRDELAAADAATSDSRNGAAA